MRTLISTLLLIFSLNGLTQANDSLLHHAKEFAYAGEYQKSIELLKSDGSLAAQLLLARVYAWSHQYASSLQVCDQTIQEFPEVASIYQIAATTALWGGKWSACYQYVEKGLNQGSDTLTLSIIKIKALMGDKNWTEAAKLCDALSLQFSENQELKTLHEAIQKKLFQKELIIRHARDYFTLDSSEWRNSSVTLKNKTKYGPLLLSVNQSNRFDLEGVQGEAEFYPKLDSNYYAYLDLGVSNSELFPNLRNGVSIFRSLPKGFELELGYRNMLFKEVGQVWFFLGSVTKYFGNNQCTYRFTSIHSPDGRSITHGLKLIHYLDEELSFVSLELGSGTNARDFQAYSTFKPFSNINSKRIQLDYKKFVTYRVAFTVTGAYEEASFRENQQGKRWTLGAGIHLKF